MFAVEQYPNEGRPWPLQFTDQSSMWSKWLVDHERGLYFVLLYMSARSNDMHCLLGDGRIAIPFGTEFVYWESHTDPVTGQSYKLTRFRFFGNMPTPTMKNPYPKGWFLPHSFANEADKEHWLRIAAEAVLVYGRAGTGLHSPEGAYRVDVNGEHLRLSDFGYTTVRPEP